MRNVTYLYPDRPEPSTPLRTEMGAARAPLERKVAMKAEMMTMH